MFASEGDPVNVGRQVSPTWEDRWGRGRPPNGGDAGSDDAAAGVARRLQGRVDRQRWLLDRMRADPLVPEPAGLAELLEVVRRMRRDTESILILHGQDPSARAGGVQRLPEVLAEAVQTAEEPRRVDVARVPEATLTPSAATEVMHVLAELLDHVTAVYPGARVEVSGAIEERGGLAVEVRALGAARHDPDGLGGRRALSAAERLAQRSRSGIVVRTPQSGGGGPVASIHCPGSVVTVPEPAWAPLPWESERAPQAERFPPERYEPPREEPYLPSFAPSALDLPLADLPPLDFTEPPRVNGNGHGPAPLYTSSSGVDELFGPMLDLGHQPADEVNSTPIFEAIASAWFREDAPASGNGSLGNGSLGNGSLGNGSLGNGSLGNGSLGNGSLGNGSLGNGSLGNGSLGNGSLRNGGQAASNGDGVSGGGAHSGGAHRGDNGDRAPRNWETPSDNEWRAAAERAARPEPEAPTAGGLPRRRPGSQLVPPPRAGAGIPEPEQAERVPDRVRQRLSTYQRGLRQGRHRAEPTRADPGDPAAW